MICLILCSQIRTVPTDYRSIIFCAVYDCAGKADLRKGLLKSKKKIGGNHAFFSNISKKRLNKKQRMAFFSKLKLNNL